MINIDDLDVNELPLTNHVIKLGRYFHWAKTKRGAAAAASTARTSG